MSHRRSMCTVDTVLKIRTSPLLLDLVSRLPFEQCCTVIDKNLFYNIYSFLLLAVAHWGPVTRGLSFDFPSGM
jgi:hypothetical protein